MMSDIFAPLTDQQRQLLIDNLSIHTYKRNQNVYQEGDRPFLFFCLLSGKVKVYKEGVGGRNQIMQVLRAVQYFGLRAYLAGQKYTTSSAAFEKCIIASIPLKIFTNVLRENAQLAYYFLRNYATQLGTVSERTVNLTQKHIRARLAEGILFLKKSYGLEEDGCTLSIYLSREDMASLCNMTTANAIRTLSKFAAEKLIAIDGRKIKIIDEEGIEKISIMG